MGQFAGLFQNALQIAIVTADNILAAGTLIDEAGQPLVCQTQSEYSFDLFGPLICYVSIEPGPISQTKSNGVIGLDDTGTQETHILRADDSKLIWQFYTTLETQRKYLADWFIWNVSSGYAVVNNIRINSYPIEVFRNNGILPYQENRWDKTEYPPPDLGEQRPFGLPWRASVKMRCTLLAAWGEPYFTPESGVLNLAPNNAPGNIGPPTTITFS